MAGAPQPTSRDKLPTVVHGIGEETAAGPTADKTVSSGDFVPTRLAHYKVLRKLGQGGMGWVLLAEDTHLGRRVALKVMRGKQAADKESRERFQIEAKAAAALKHDHIITIYQVGEDRGIPFLAMELLEGGTLQQRLEYPKPLSTGTAVRIAREIAAGLQAAHERGVVHRDIKPANIWLESPKGRVKILDFGLARQADAQSGLTQVGEIVGTPHYMAPEQARGKGIDARTDLFSLGCILYRMTTGKLPFAGETLLATLTAIAIEMPTPVEQLNPQVPAALADLIRRLLAKDAAERPATAATVIAELVAIERELGASRSDFGLPVPQAIQIKIDTSPALTPPAKSARKNARASDGGSGQSMKWIVAGGAVGIVLALAVVGFTWWLPSLADSQPIARPRGLRPAKNEGLDLRVVEPLEPASQAASRRMAEWALARGGSAAMVEVEVPGLPASKISPPDQVPAEGFTLLGARLAGSSTLVDADLANLPRVTGLRWLDLNDTRIGDVGIGHLRGLAALTSLQLAGTQITDEGVRHVARQCPNLKRLAIGRTQCSAAVVQRLSLGQLQELSLDSLPVGDDDLAGLKPLHHLANLDLARTKVGDLGLDHLRWLPALTTLRLDETGITDEGLATLGKLARLDWLQIKDTRQITDAGLTRLSALPSLQRLDASKGQFSADALRALKARLSQCEVVLHDP